MALKRERLLYFMDIWYILWSFGNLGKIWYIFPCFGLLCQEKSGIPAHQAAFI
jgi:hypothetical protein